MKNASAPSMKNAQKHAEIFRRLDQGRAGAPTKRYKKSRPKTALIMNYSFFVKRVEIEIDFELEDKL